MVWVGSGVVEGRLGRFLLLTILAVYFATATITRKAMGNGMMSTRGGRPLVNTAMSIDNAALNAMASVSNGFILGLASSGTALRFGCLKCRSGAVGIARGNGISLKAVTLSLSTGALKSIIVASSVTMTHGAPITMAALTPRFVRRGLNARRFPRVLGSAPNMCTAGRNNTCNSSGVGVHNFGDRGVTIVMGNVPVGSVR